MKSDYGKLAEQRELHSLDFLRNMVECRSYRIKKPSL